MEMHIVAPNSPISLQQMNTNDIDMYSSEPGQSIQSINGETEDGSNIMEDKSGFYAKVIIDYVAEDEDQLNIKQDMIVFIMIEYMTESGWWYGIDASGNDGWIPSNYLMQFDETQKEE
eukprot:892862_1